MRYRALACDYDGTLATGGHMDDSTVAALGRARTSGRRLVLVTGRVLDDLQRRCADLTPFDLVVAENGGVLFDPGSGRAEDLAERPPAAFLAALTDAGVPFSVGRVIVATMTPHESTVLGAIRAMGLDLHVVFNRTAVMVLPLEVSKESGLRAALARLGVPQDETVGVGDAENDHAFLACCGVAVAVANAIPAIAERADVVTSGVAGAGVVELIDRWLLHDMAPRPSG
jgi:hydroxymethylpyrimidine pyrophosphatase-like HAD family hydrolase